MTGPDSPPPPPGPGRVEAIGPYPPPSPPSPPPAPIPIPPPLPRGRRRFCLSYVKQGKPIIRRDLSADGVETVGAVVVRVAERTGEIAEIRVLNESGEDVTFDFACFVEDDFRPVAGPTLAAVHRQWLDRGLPSHTWQTYVEAMPDV